MAVPGDVTDGRGAAGQRQLDAQLHIATTVLGLLGRRMFPMVSSQASKSPSKGRGAIELRSRWAWALTMAGNRVEPAQDSTRPRPPPHRPANRRRPRCLPAAAGPRGPPRPRRRPPRRQPPVVEVRSVRGLEHGGPSFHVLHDLSTCYTCRPVEGTLSGHVCGTEAADTTTVYLKRRLVSAHGTPLSHHVSQPLSSSPACRRVRTTGQVRPTPPSHARPGATAGSHQ